MEMSDVLPDLYLRAPADFVAVRTQRMQEAREAGDADQARQISRLPKPSAAAWLVNLLAARKAPEIDQLIQLGSEMRDAEQDLAAADLRRLGKQRTLLIRSIARLGQDLAAEAGHRMSAAALTEVEQTLHAAMSDEAAAEAVRSGRLVRALSSNGIDPVDVEGAVAAPSVPLGRARRPALRTVDDPDAGRRLAEAEERSEQAGAAAAAAEEARREVRARRTELSERRLSLTAERDELAARLADIDREQAALVREEDILHRAAASADRNAEVTARAAERAAERVARLRRETRA